MRANGVIPSSLALVSLITMTAAAPSLRGQALPAVTVPSGRNAGLRPERPSRVVPGRMPSSVLTTVPSGRVTGMISSAQNPESRLFSERFCDRTAYPSWRFAGHVAVLRHVLGGLTHGDVHVGESGRGLPLGGAALAALQGAGFGVGEDLVLRAVGHAKHEAAHGLDAGAYERVAFACLDGVGGHADALQRGGAVAVDRDAGDVRHVGEHGDDAADVVARLTGWLPAAHDQIVDGVSVELRDLVEDRAARSERTDRPDGSS
ncbi:MAG: hypothetical protein V9G14_10455 [Cypionkella sp.]